MIKAVALFALVAVAFAAESTENKDLTSSNTFGLGYAGAYGPYDGIYGDRLGYGRGLGMWGNPAVGAYPYANGAYPYAQGAYPYVNGVYPRSRSIIPGVGYPGYTGYTGYPGYTPYAGVTPAPYVY